MRHGTARRLPVELAAPPGHGRVVQRLEQVHVPGVLSSPLGELQGEPEPPGGEVVVQPEPPAVHHKLLAPGVGAGDGRDGPPVDPGQVSLLLLGQGQGSEKFETVQ